jgi:hypothetical protein
MIMDNNDVNEHTRNGSIQERLNYLQSAIKISFYHSAPSRIGLL